MQGGRLLRIAVALAWAVLVAWSTLTPGGEAAGLDAPTRGFSTCILCPATGTADVLRNVALFLPLGLLLGVRFGPLVALALGVLVSAGIEVAQLWIPGRFPGLSDIFWNGLGAALGALAVSPLRKWLRVGTPLLPMRASLPYFGQWTPEGLILEPYRGKVLQASLNGIAFPDGRFPSDARPDLALAGDWSVSVTMTKGPEPVSPSTVIRLHGESGIFYLAVIGEDLVWHERTWGQRFGFSTADPRFSGALRPYKAGEIVTVGASRTGGRLCLVAGDVEDCRHGVSPAQTWMLVAGPKIRDANPQTGVDTLWMAVLFFTMGLLGGVRRRTLVLSAAAAAGLWLAAGSTPLDDPGLVDLVGMALGIATGVAFRPVVRLLLDDAGVGSRKPA